MLLLGREAAHRTEARQDQRNDAGLGPAGQHRVRPAAPDQLGALSDRVRAGRAGRHGRVVRPSIAERDRKLPTGGVDQTVREPMRRGAVGPAVAQDVVLLDDGLDPADGGAVDDGNASGVVGTVETGILDRLLRRGQSKQDVVVESALLLRRDEPLRFEALHLGRDSHRVRAGVEGADEVDPALAGDGGGPGGRRVVPDRGEGPEARDDHSLRHGPELSLGACPREASPSLPWRQSWSPSCRIPTAGSTNPSGTGSAAYSRTRATASRSGAGTAGLYCATSPSSGRSAISSRRSRRSTERS